MATPVPKRKRSRFAIICVALGLVTGSLTPGETWKSRLSLPDFLGRMFVTRIRSGDEEED